MTPIRTLVVDDHALVRRGIRSLLEQSAHIVVAGEGASGDEALMLAAALAPDVILMDLKMPGMNGLDATRVLTSERPPRKVIVLSGHGTTRWVRRALRAGAHGYVLKTETAANLEQAVTDVHAGGRWFSADVQSVIAGLVLDPGSMQADPLDRLTQRQRTVLQLVAEGYTNRQIAAALGITESTVDTHRTELMRRLGLHDVTAVVRFACEEGLVGVE